MFSGVSESSKIYAGTSEVSKIYLGVNEVWSGMDPDAAAYVTLVEAALGTSITPTQKDALNTFYKVGKVNGWYSALKRMYLPIWANANANARCMVSGTSGSFVDGVTHAAGYVQGDESAGGFTTDTGPVTLGLSRIDVSLFKGVFEQDTRHATVNTGRFCGNTTTQLWVQSFATNLTGRLRAFKTGGHTQRCQDTNYAANGVYIGSSTANDLRRVGTLRFNGTWTFAENTSADSGTMSNTLINFLQSTNSKQMLFGFGHGMSLDDMEGLARSSKTLWETATGLTLNDAGTGVISAVEATGVTVTTAQRNAIHAFFTAGNNEGWLSTLKRFYLPIWANEEANTIDWITRTKGSFVGGVTHAAGYVQGDGTGYFDTGSTCASLGITRTDAYGCFLAKTQLIGAAMGARNTSSQQFGLQRGSATSLWSQIMTNLISGGGLNSVALGDGNFNGIISHGNLPSGRFAARRTAAARDEYLTAHTAAGTPPTLEIYLMATNLVGSPSSISTTEFGAFMFGTGITSAQDALCTAAVKTLWETCTGLTLP